MAKSKGYSLVEMLVGLSIGLVVVMATMRLFDTTINSSMALMDRAEMQQNARAAINSLSTDISLAGADLPPGGIELVTSTVNNPRFGCDASGKCPGAISSYNVFPLDTETNSRRMYYLLPGRLTGLPTPNTWLLALAYADNQLATCPIAAESASGSQVQITLGTCATNPPAGKVKYNDAAQGLQVGDLIMLTAPPDKVAVGVITTVGSNGQLTFADGDGLYFNQPGANDNNLASLIKSVDKDTYVSATRVWLVTYYIDRPSIGPDSITATSDDTVRLMRQVNSRKAVPVAENIQDLQLSYDIFDDTTSVETTNTPDANGKPNQIRKVNILLTAKSGVKKNTYFTKTQYLRLASSVDPRNLSFRDRYQ